MRLAVVVAAFFASSVVACAGSAGGDPLEPMYVSDVTSTELAVDGERDEVERTSDERSITPFEREGAARLDHVATGARIDELQSE
jgi:hypothetical protein